MSTTKDNIIKKYLSIVKTKKRLPTYSDFLSQSISRNQIRESFGNLGQLHSLIETDHYDSINEYVAHENYVFSEKRLEELSSNLKKYKKYVITTAVEGKAVHTNFYKSLKNYCSRNNALLLILPSADVASRSVPNSVMIFNGDIKNEHFVFNETKLNNRFFISNIRISAKQIQPTTGLSRIGQKNGSYVFASPKQSLEVVATSAQRDKEPMVLMTPGAITVADYKTDKYMSQRTSYIAENDHILGAIIVEIENKKQFYFRQIQANNKGEFIDLATKYYPNDTVSTEEMHFYAGDWHSGSTDQNVILGLSKFLSDYNVQNFFVGDFFDGYSISHHHINIPLKRVSKIMANRHSLTNELSKGSMDMKWLLEKINGALVMIKGNHDEVLEKYLMNANYIKDDNNHYHSLKMAKDYLDNKNVLKEAYYRHGSLTQEEKDRIIWLERDEEYRIAGVECGQHGDKGANGARPSLMTIEKAYGNCIVGHTHTPGILRGVFRVGTFSKLDLEYVEGPSSWMHTGCVIYNDGSRQLINFINSKYKV